MNNKVKLSKYFQANKKAIKDNWKDEYFRRKYDNDLSKYINHLVERAEMNCYDKQYLTPDINILEYKTRIVNLLLD